MSRTGISSSQGSDRDICVVIPANNEEATVGAVAVAALAALDGRSGSASVVIVDDGSSDATYAACIEAACSDPRISVVRHETRRGKSAAIVTGAASTTAEWLVTIDGDGQSDPYDIGRLVQAASIADDPQSPMIVIGRRARRGDGPTRALASRIANGVLAVVMGHDVYDSGSGLALISLETFQVLPKFDNMHRFMPTLVLGLGGSVLEVAVQNNARKYGRSHYTNTGRAIAGAVDLVGVSWLRSRMIRPASAKSGN